MTTKGAFFLIFTLCFLVQACGRGQVTTAAEPDFISISTDSSTPADAEMRKLLSESQPLPADRIQLAESIEGVDPAALPAAPSAPLVIYQVGDIHKFWTHDSKASSFKLISARLMLISKHAYFWQDQDTKALNASGQPVNDADWKAAGDSFDNSYERVRAVFGMEESPGLDGDTRLFVIHSDSVGQVGGYFGQADQLPVEVEPHSNQGQFFYISNTYSGGVASDYYREVLAHEFQHMIQKHIDPNEEGWMNEGMSMLAQQVAGMRGDNFVPDYLLKPDQSLWYWSSKPQDYGQAYLFLDYLYEQLGEGFIKDVAASPQNGLASIDEIVAKDNSPRGTDELYADAISAAFFNNANWVGGRFSYSVAEIPVMKPRYEFTSVPAEYKGSVQQYGGVDIMTFAGKGGATLSFTGDQRVKLIPADAHSGDHFWWSTRNDSSLSALTREVDLSSVSKATLNYWAWYNIEEDWDYAYLMVSTDGGQHWDLVPATSSRETNPNDQNLGYGFSGISGGDAKNPKWIQESVDFSAYAGKKIQLRFAMQNDLSVNEFGFAIDDISIPEISWSDDMESVPADWTSDGFVLTQNHVPQVWWVRAVAELNNDTISIKDIEVINGKGSLKFNFDDMKRIDIFVIGETRYTTIPAFYSVEVR